MAFSVYLPLYLGVVLAIVAPRLAGTLPPRAGMWCLTTAASAAALSWLYSLVTIALTGLIRTSFVARQGHWSADEWRQVDPVGVWAAYASGIALIVCLGLLGRAVRRELATARQIHRLTRAFATDDAVVFVDDDMPHAYAVGGRSPRIVVSRGLLRMLCAAERRAVLSHEKAHVRHRHHMHLRVIRLAAAAHPLLRGCVPAGALAVERWADEEAALLIGDRRLVARALLRAALAGAAAGSIPEGVLAHAAPADAGGVVGRRVSALMKAPPRLRPSVAGVTLMLLVATVAAPVYSADHLDTLFDSASTPVHRHVIVVGAPPVRSGRTVTLVDAPTIAIGSAAR